MQSFVLNTVGIPLSSIRKGQSHYSFEIDMEFLPIVERIKCRQIKLDAHVTLLGEDILVKLNVFANGSFNCDCCGEPFDREIKGSVTTLFTADPLKLEGTAGDEIRLLDPQATELNLKQELIDAFYLSIPEKVVCHEECKGLCNLCGTNLNIKDCQCDRDSTDPRWDELKKLKFD